jgi:hypothetical protein
MDSIKLAQYFFKQIKEREAQIVDSLSSGNVKSMEEYKYAIGALSALRALAQDLKETLQKYDIDE